MANIADGWLEIQPLTVEEIAVIKGELLKHWVAFTYGGEAAIEVDSDKLTVIFCGRWTCDAAWDAIDAILNCGSNSVASSVLINAQILGRGKELASGYQAMVKKDRGGISLKRYRKKI
jgi:hypothetical protein